jgi:hypothetical protein
MAETQPSPADELSSSMGQLKSMFTSLLSDAKNEILSHVKTSIDRVYADFEVVADGGSGTNEDAHLCQTSQQITSMLSAVVDQPKVERG